MKKNENIFVTLQIGKDEKSGDLTINTFFDNKAPNFSTDKNRMNWCPTIEEIEFVNEAFVLLPKKNQTKQKDEIHIELQIIKEENSGELMLNVNFDKDADNFSSNKDGTWWSPNPEELNFLSEAIEIFTKGKGGTNYKKSKNKDTNSDNKETKEAEEQNDFEEESEDTETSKYSKEDVYVSSEGDSKVDMLLKRKEEEKGNLF